MRGVFRCSWLVVVGLEWEDQVEALDMDLEEGDQKVDLKEVPDVVLKVVPEVVLA